MSGIEFGFAIDFAIDFEYEIMIAVGSRALPWFPCVILRRGGSDPRGQASLRSNC